MHNKTIDINMIKKIFYTALMAFFSQFVSAQELWQLSPWAVDSNYVMGAMASGEPTWVHKDSLGITGGGAGTVKGDGASNKIAYWASSDSLTNDSLFSYLPTSDRVGIGITTPTGLGVGLHINGGTFTDLHLTNSTTGTTSGDGTSLFINASDVYLTNRENGDITLATQNIERIKINETGTVNVASLDTDNAAPTTTGTTRKVITDANGLLSFKTDTDGTVTSVGVNTGTSGTDVSVSGSPVTGSGTITLNIPTASGTNTGKLSSTDWTTFNNKFLLPALTTGSVLFSNGTTIAQNNSKFFWNNSTERLGIGTSSPSSIFNVNGNSASTFERSNFNPVIILKNNAGAGTGIQFTDGASPTTKYLWYNSGTWNFGGSGAAVTNKTLHVDGGVTIGDAYSGTAVNANSLNVQGSIKVNTRTGTAVTGAAFTSDGTLCEGGIAGSGTVNQVAYFSGTNTVTSSSNLTWIDGTQMTIRANTGTPLVIRRNNTYGTVAITTISDGVVNHLASWASSAIDVDLSFTPTTSAGLQVPAIYMVASTGNVGVGNLTNPARKLDVNGELRVRDMVTDNPSFIAGVDNDGDFARITAGTGLSLSGTTLNVSGVGTVTSISTNNGITGGTITSTGTVGLTGQALALHNASTNGLFARTGAGTVANRTITANTAAGEFGLSVSNGDGVSGNPSISLLSNYATLSGLGDQNLTTTYTKYNFSSGSDGDDTGIVADIVNNEIDIVTSGLYKFEYSLNCKSNTSAHIVSTRMQNVGTGSSLGGIRNHYFNNTNEYCHNNAIGIFNMTAGSSISLYVKTNSGTPNINDCYVSLFVNRVD